MSMTFEVVQDMTHDAVIKVIGVGGGGCNAIDNMIESNVHGVDFICANTDAQALKRNKSPNRVQLGVNLTRGLGAGANPDVGRNAALEDRERITEMLRGSNMVFVTSGMGGGTGTGAAPVVAEIARDLGILTVGVVTKPFMHEGKRMDVANRGIDELKKHVDSLIVIPNQKLLDVLGDEVTLRAAFKAADDVLCGAVAGIAEVITCPGMINVDFADVKTVMSEMGLAMMGSAYASGPDRARVATENAIASPLLDNVSLNGARGVLVNISTCPDGLFMKEYHEIMGIIRQYADSDAQVKFGSAEIADMPADMIRITLIATGLEQNARPSRGSGASVRSGGTTGTHKPAPNDNFFDDADGSRPALKKPGAIRSARGTRQQNTSMLDESGEINQDTYEIPAFLRKQAD